MKNPYKGPLFCAPDATPARELRTYLITDHAPISQATPEDFTEVHGRDIGEAAAYWVTRNRAREVAAGGLTVVVHIAAFSPSNLHDNGVPRELHRLCMELKPAEAQP